MVRQNFFQVVKPLYTDSLKSWVGHIPEDVMKDLPKISPMLKKLGYDPLSKDPSYGKPDQEVQDKYDGLNFRIFFGFYEIFKRG